MSRLAELFARGTINADRGMGGPVRGISVSVCNEIMGRYRKDLTHPERQIARLAEATSQLRRELEEMVRHRRRTDRLTPERDVAPDVPRPSKKSKRR